MPSLSPTMTQVGWAGRTLLSKHHTLARAAATRVLAAVTRQTPAGAKHPQRNPASCLLLPRQHSLICLCADCAPTTTAATSQQPTQQGNIAAWRKAEGDSVAPGDILAEIETDKATIEWEAQEEGFIAKILKPAGG